MEVNGGAVVIQVITYYAVDDVDFTNRQQEEWEVRGHRNSSGVHPNPTDEQRAEFKALYCRGGINVSGSFIK